MKHNKEDWAKHIKNWQSGDLSQAEYCRCNSLKQAAFTYWKKRLSEPDESEFVALEAPSRRPLIELTIHEGLRFELKFNIQLYWSSRSFE